jgi:hypothetical protein
MSTQGLHPLAGPTGLARRLAHGLSVHGWEEAGMCTVRCSFVQSCGRRLVLPPTVNQSQHVGMCTV